MQPIQEQKSVKDILHGKTLTFTSPSGLTFTIREQNGNDDDILSNSGLAKDGSNITNFISSIVLESSLTGGGPLSVATARNLLVRDRVFIMIMSRIHSIGDMLKFKYQWSDLPFPVEYEEDLNKYIWDYSKEFPLDTSDINYFKYRIQPYTERNYGSHIYTLKSGKTISFNLMDGNGEKYLLALNEGSITVNEELKARSLHLKQEDDRFMKVENFSFFTKSEMTEIHSLVNEIDPTYFPFTEITHPDNNSTVNLPLFGINDFFYPKECQ